MAKDKDNKLRDEKIARSISQTTHKVSGVSRVARDSLTENLTKVVLGQSTIEGVNLTWDDEDRLNVDLHIVTVYGLNIPQISYEVQMRVKEMLEQKYNLNVQAINVYVEGVEQTKER